MAVLPFAAHSLQCSQQTVGGTLSIWVEYGCHDTQTRTESTGESACWRKEHISYILWLPESQIDKCKDV